MVMAMVVMTPTLCSSSLTSPQPFFTPPPKGCNWAVTGNSEQEHTWELGGGGGGVPGSSALSSSCLYSLVKHPRFWGVGLRGRRGGRGRMRSRQTW